MLHVEYVSKFMCGNGCDNWECGSAILCHPKGEIPIAHGTNKRHPNHTSLKINAANKEEREVGMMGGRGLDQSTISVPLDTINTAGVSSKCNEKVVNHMH